MTWQALIRTAALSQFARRGTVGTFRLAAGDFLSLAREIEPAMPQVDPRDATVGMACSVYCPELRRGILVHHWLE